MFVYTMNFKSILIIQINPNKYLITKRKLTLNKNDSMHWLNVLKTVI